MKEHPNEQVAEEHRNSAAMPVGLEVIVRISHLSSRPSWGGWLHTNRTGKVFLSLLH
jgi:hypothetical protein